MMKRLNGSVLEKGDIILTTTDEFLSGVIRKATKSDISHAMLYVEHSSVIHAVSEGVRSENTQRIFLKEELAVHVKRLRDGLSSDDAQKICAYVRSKVGSEYSYLEAARAWKERGKNFSARQFCSRLVAQGYLEVGHKLVDEPNFCTPAQLSKSPMLVDVKNSTIEASEEEVKFWKNHDSGTDRMHQIQNLVLDGARKLNPKIQDFNDLIKFVIENPKHDAAVAKLYSESGYLNFWQYDVELHPWHYELALMGSIPDHESVRQYCLHTISGEPRDDNRFTQSLAAYQSAHLQFPRTTLEHLIQLYFTLVTLHAKRYDTAAEWLKHNGR